MKTISDLTNADLPIAFQLEKCCHLFPWSENTFYSNQGERYLNKKIIVDDQLVGFLICQTVVDEASLFNIAIHPDYRKQGLAKLLLKQLITELDAKQVKMLWLEVRESNTVAIALYQQLGFNEISVRKNYYPTKHGKEDAIIMAYTIAF